MALHKNCFHYQEKLYIKLYPYKTDKPQKFQITINNSNCNMKKICKQTYNIKYKNLISAL